ncbi:shikimate dehydrogenase [Thermomonas flagellata]|uniref:shikimate dehydrogenase n=1 Tax=Thermomonas flagellata TaxID=2888524 RepID=UPI003CE51786
MHAVFGHPVAHSRSPRIHALFGAQTGIGVRYEAIDAAPARFAQALAAFAARGGRGANVTLPLKEDAFALCRSASPRARRAGAVNTLVRADGGWHGDNTDGAGLVRDLSARHGLDLRDRRVLLLGAGGAARGVAPALLDAGIGALWIANRTAARADALADALGDPARVQARGWDALPGLGGFDLLVNATAATRGGALPALPMALVAPHSAAVDLGYGTDAAPFLAWARAAGCAQALDGLGMLVEQAAESFQCWHGVRPDTDPVYADLRRLTDTQPTSD